MSTTPATSWTPTVHCPPETLDDVALASHGTGVASLNDLVGHPATVTFCAPSGLGSCEDCVEIHAIAVATITWPDPHERTGHGEITVCRDCLGHQITCLSAELDLDVPIDVEVPAWTARDLTFGVGADLSRFLVVEDGGRYLADEVEHARRLLALGQLGLSLRAANRLLRHHDQDLARTVETVLRAAT